MSSSDAMFEALSVYFQYANERAAHVKKTVFPISVDQGHSKFLLLLDGF